MCNSILQKGCWDDGADVLVASLQGFFMETVTSQTVANEIEDLKIRMSNDWFLEVFVCSIFEPWVLSLPSKTIIP